MALGNTTLNVWGIGEFDKFIWGENQSLTNPIDNGSLMNWDRPFDDGEFCWPIVIGGEPVCTNVSADNDNPWVLEVYDEDGALLGQVISWFKGAATLERSKASTLHFSISYDNVRASDLKDSKNKVWLRDRWGLLVQTFNITETNETREGQKLVLKISCQSRIADFAREPVVNYTTGFTGEIQNSKTVGEIISELLDLQVMLPKISMGVIDPAIADASFVFDAQNTTLMGALNQLQDLIPKADAGTFYIDGLDQLNWKTRIGTSGEVLTTADAVVRLGLKIDYKDMVTRLYLYGSGKDVDNHLTLIDGGEANEYKEKNVATYGIRPLLKKDRRIKDPASLVAIADRILDELAEPVIRLVITKLINLAIAQESAFSSFNDIYIGSTYRIIDTTQSIDTQVTVRKINYDLHHPLALSVEMNNRTRQFEDLFRDIFEALNEPLDIDGELYPHMARNYTTVPNNPRYRAGDVRRIGIPEMYDGDDWESLQPPVKTAILTLPHGSTAVIGATNGYAAGNHVHPGFPYFEDDTLVNLIANFPPNGDGDPDPVVPANALAFLTSEFKMFMIRTVSSVKYWVPVSGTWIQDSIPTAGIDNGDMWLDSNDHKLAIYMNSVWRSMTWEIEAGDKLVYAPGGTGTETQFAHWV